MSTVLVLVSSLSHLGNPSNCKNEEKDTWENKMAPWIHVPRTKPMKAHRKKPPRKEAYENLAITILNLDLCATQLLEFGIS
jgi:hypothetical protein